MRQFPIVILIIISIGCLGQTNQLRVFETTEYMKGSPFMQKFDTVKAENRLIDIYFFKNHFHIPYYLPETLIDKQYKNQTISKWRDSTSEKDLKQNWENKYTYDNFGRIIKFTYSGCIICSNLPYNYNVTYNLKGQIEQITETLYSNESFRLHYNDRGGLVKIEQYSLTTLVKQSTLLN